MIRCDKPMKRSKERCYSQDGIRWECANDCEHCICALQKKRDGTWVHLYFLAHTKKEAADV